uniref:Phosphatidylinositol transfer protein alpha isoform-like n=1 Tax=Phallusia mammillata TaxID=59560 RepID=A0A6F9DNY2_9ASCI|nr:phosphatidylinositol transfer protein alpha isoform-like [Phallusia mammillata]
MHSPEMFFFFRFFVSFILTGIKMLIKEYRIVLPMTVEEYQVAQLWSVAEASKNETGGGEGIEVLENHPYQKGDECGQYTKKIYHLASRVPKFLTFLLPNGSLDIQEEAWNAYPYCKTVITNPGYMKDSLEICIKTWHKPDLGETENVHKLSEKDWKATTVVKIDIANDSVKRGDYKSELDPQLVKSEKAQRGPLSKNWINELQANRQNDEKNSCSEKTAYMCAYKLVTCKFKWLGLQKRVESLIQTQEQRLFTNFHRQVFCWMDKWFGLTMDDIRRIEEETKKELDEMRRHGSIRGTKVED